MASTWRSDLPPCGADRLSDAPCPSTSRFASRPADPSDAAFRLCARFAVREALAQADAIPLEPIARVEVEADAAHHGTVLSTLLQRRGRVLDAEVGPAGSRVEAEVPLVEMLGYSSVLRSATSGSGDDTLAFSHVGR